MRTLFSRILDVVFRTSRERRLDEEMHAHLELLADEYEPLLVTAIVGALTLIAVVSCAGPIRRLLSVDPLIALREE